MPFILIFITEDDVETTFALSDEHFPIWYPLIADLSEALVKNQIAEKVDTAVPADEVHYRIRHTDATATQVEWIRNVGALIDAGVEDFTKQLLADEDVEIMKGILDYINES